MSNDNQMKTADQSKATKTAINRRVRCVGVNGLTFPSQFVRPFPTGDCKNRGNRQGLARTGARTLFNLDPKVELKQLPL